MPNNENRVDATIDLAIIAKGGIAVYCKTTILDYHIALLSEIGYKIIQFDDRVITNTKELHADLQHKLGFPDYYGKNFDALDDCMRDYEISETGDVFVFPKLDHLDHRSIFHLLDVLAFHCKRKLVEGKKLVILVQVDNPNFSVSKSIASLDLRIWNDED